MTQVQPWHGPVTGTRPAEPTLPRQREFSKPLTRRVVAAGNRRDDQTVRALHEALAARHAILPAALPAHVLPLRARIMKRALDVTGALAILLFAAPVIALAALAVVTTSRGPLFFVQHRVGRGGAMFRMYKLRSMRVNNDDREHREYFQKLIRGEAEHQGGVYKLVTDPRITPVGRVIRRFSIDELPQLWNVLRGDMSLVGPRPALPHEVELYDADARLRLAVQPGLTGLWQVSGRCRLSFAEMIALDVQYWRSWSFRSDLVILLKTPLAALSGSGAA